LFDRRTCASATGPPETGLRTLKRSEPTLVVMTTSASCNACQSKARSPRTEPKRPTWPLSRATTVTAPA
jgi:hypothetical protein